MTIAMNWSLQQIQVSFIHASCFRVDRRTLWLDLMHDSPQSPTPWVIIGDFNATLYSHEKRGPGSFSLDSAAEYGAMVDVCSMSQIQAKNLPGPIIDAGGMYALFWTEASAMKNGSLAFKIALSCGRIVAGMSLRLVDPCSYAEAKVQDQIDGNGMNDQLFALEADAKMGLAKALENHEKLWDENARIRSIPTVDHLDLLESIPKTLQEIDNFRLDSLTGDAEIRTTVWELDPDSSPGPDGFYGAFFRRCWSIVDKEMEGAETLDKFRPLCMGNFFYKIISKVMALHLEPLLPRLISEEQGAFQKGKMIHDNISIASELANLMFSSTRGGGLGLKIDISKAYDTISWSFLFQVMRRFGFYEIWIKRLHQILSSTKIFVLLNGGPQAFFGVERGLRQGDPIYPMLFIIAKEVLSRGLSRLVQSKMIQSIQGPRGTPTPGHILFADNIFIFSNANLSFPTRHLGVEIFKGRVKKETLMPVMDRVKGHIAGWKGKLLSMAGRVELVRSVVSAIPNHSFAVYWWPSFLLETMERWMRNFIWTGEVDSSNAIAVRWDFVCKPKEEGGLGIRRLRDTNMAMLNKMVWRFKHGKHAASSFLRARFVKKNGAFNMGCRHSSIALGTRKVWKFVDLNERWIIGNGGLARFWKDKWWGPKAIMDEIQDADISLLDSDAKVESTPWKITHCYREVNTAADYLAKKASKSGVSACAVPLPHHINVDLEDDVLGRHRYRFF
ncbi:uncharacterized protein LOC122070717 [Macadamia integrifolia]|uniref:uncharacterized protein LOC122070717 n=1 Tax=Macadamia integrifolia TaxID=60698 RepID=UPI001C4EB79F|nr:uncharacterized protein LOC122070717 [Macadamia integrifolia]